MLVHAAMRAERSEAKPFFFFCFVFLSLVTVQLHVPVLISACWSMFSRLLSRYDMYSQFLPSLSAYDHITANAPDTIGTRKLNAVELV